MNLSLLQSVKALLADGNAGTQTKLLAALATQGIYTTQPTLSRLLRKLGAVKMQNVRGEVIYSLTHEPSPILTDAPFSHLVLSIRANEFMIVIRTKPGSASLIASVLDQHAQELAILGTVAGDDTLFVVPISIYQIQAGQQKIEKWLLAKSSNLMS